MAARGHLRRPMTCAVAAVAVSGTAACASLSPDAGAAADVATRFHHAIAADDGAGACALLLPTVVEELEDSEGTACPEAVLSVDVPEGTGIVETHADGRQAQVVLTSDVVFLTASGDRWLVMAASCTQRPGRPYDCDISEG